MWTVLVMLGHSLEKGSSGVKHPGPGMMLEGTIRCSKMTAPGKSRELIG